MTSQKSKPGTTPMPAKGLDEDAPYIIESYQSSDGQYSAPQAPPSYTYSRDPRRPSQPRSWDEAARAKTMPINPSEPRSIGHVYVDVDEETQEFGLGGTPSTMPGSLNSTITGYATGLGWELSKLCALAYILPPFSSVLLLVFETTNDLVRFHAYQAGFGGAAVIVGTWILNGLLGFHWLSWLLLRVSLFVSWYCGYLAHQSATSLEREPFWPVLGAYAVQCVGDE